MSKNNIVKDVKKLVTDIYADKSREESLIAYRMLWLLDLHPMRPAGFL